MEQRDPSQSLQSLEERLTLIEDTLNEKSVDESQIEDGTLQTSIKDLEDRMELEITRLRAQTDHDYSRCQESIEVLQTRLDDNSQSIPPPPAKMNPKIDFSMNLDSFDPTQRGLFKQLGGMLNSLTADKQKAQLTELRRNLSGQPDGAFKAKQSQVLDILEQQLQV